MEKGRVREERPRSRSPQARKEITKPMSAVEEVIKVSPQYVVDREKTCPMLLRVFCNMGRHHRLDEFNRNSVPSNELQIYTWLDCTLRELMTLIREVNPDTRAKGTMFQFSTVYPDPRRGGFRMKDLGQTCSGRRGTDDNITLHSRKFQIGDYIDVAISLRPPRGRPY
jgi:histone deacetylase complex subunit SAP18